MRIQGYTGNLTWLESRTIYLTTHGSRAYGLATPTSDVDVKGIAVAPPSYYHGFLNHFEQAECAEPDTVVYELRKFIQLAARCEPAVIEMLFTDPSGHLGMTPVAERLIASRNLFLSQKARHTFSGFAMSQYHRLVNHHRWVVSPPGADSSAKEKEQYATWLKDRNSKRAALEAKYGYDTKAACNVVRLFTMCREILDENNVFVLRPDRERLLAIRGGAWSFEQFQEWALTQDAAMDELVKASKLPHTPNMKALDKLCVELVEESLRSL